MAEPSPTQKHQDARRAAGSKSKPYSKKPKSISTSSSEESVLPQDIVGTALNSYGGPPNDVPVDRPGFPTYAQYKRIESIYIESLSPRKRDKALITQSMFDNIWDVLHDPDTREVETAQFRFWVRKMFALSDSHPTQVFATGDSTTTISSVPVVVHENRPVAIREQLYDLFIYCHGRSNHGGRDKTCAVIRQHYSWVPKELTAQFVKACPTCTLKRSGNPDLIAMVREQGVNKSNIPCGGPGSKFIIPPYFGPGPNEPVMRNSEPTSALTLDQQHQGQDDELDKQRWPPSKGPLDMVVPVPRRELSPMLVDAAQVPDFVTVTPPLRPAAPPRGLSQPPAMVREVSLFNGIPHGWTVDDPESIQARARAYNAMVDQRTGIAAVLPSGRVPRIPSVVFKQTAFFNPDSAGLLPLQRTQIDADDWSSDDGTTLPPLSKNFEDGMHGGEGSMSRRQVDFGDALHDSLQPFRATNPQATERTFIRYEPEIDPTLLEDELDDDKSSVGSESDVPGDVETIANTSNLQALATRRKEDTVILAHIPIDLAKPMLIRHSAAPAALELTGLRLSSDFLRHRDTDDSSPTSPGSASSCYSQLSFHTGSTSTNPSPFTTALPTPTDEHQKTAMELAEETSGLVLGAKAISRGIDVEHPWEQEAEFPTMMNLAQVASRGVVS